MSDQESTRAPRKVATLAQKIAINKLLAEAVASAGVNADGAPLCRFLDGWNDKRIAHETGTTDGAVANVRLQLFGKLVNTAAPTPLEVLDVVARIEALTEQVKAEAEKTNALAKQIEALSLTLQRLESRA